MILNFLKKKDIWTEVGGVEGYIDAVKQLGSDHRELDNERNGYTKSDTIGLMQKYPPIFFLFYVSSFY